MSNNQTVQLEDFVHSALLQITRAVSKAAPEIKKLDGLVNPVLRSKARENDPERTRRDRRLTVIEFDVAVTATTSDESEYGIGVITALFGAGAKAKEREIDSRVSRIRFSIPIELPVSSSEY